jgi:hypothetical protein
MGVGVSVRYGCWCVYKVLVCVRYGCECKVRVLSVRYGC